MPRKGVLPEPSKIADALSKRVLYGPIPGRLDQLGAVRPLLEIPSVASKGDSDFKRALAFEELLETVVAQLDDTFPYRRAAESPTWIARGLFSLESDWSRKLKDRRDRICAEYGWSADDFRQRYSRMLYEHIASQLESQGVSDTQQRPSKIPSESTPTFDGWAQNVTNDMTEFYELLDSGMHSPPMHDREPVLRSSDILYRYARLCDTYNRDRPPAGDRSHLASSIDEVMQAIERGTPFDLRDRRRLAEEARGSASGGRPSEVFQDFLEESNQGVRILGLWNSWIARCNCRQHPARPPKESAAFCDLHMILSKLESFLGDTRDQFISGWQRREGNEALIERWEVLSGEV